MSADGKRQEIQFSLFQEPLKPIRDSLVTSRLATLHRAFTPQNGSRELSVVCLCLFKIRMNAEFHIS